MWSNRLTTVKSLQQWGLSQATIKEKTWLLLRKRFFQEGWLVCFLVCRMWLGRYAHVFWSGCHWDCCYLCCCWDCRYSVSCSDISGCVLDKKHWIYDLWILVYALHTCAEACMCDHIVLMPDKYFLILDRSVRSLFPKGYFNETQVQYKWL